MAAEYLLTPPLRRGSECRPHGGCCPEGRRHAGSGDDRRADTCYRRHHRRPAGGGRQDPGRRSNYGCHHRDPRHPGCGHDYDARQCPAPRLPAAAGALLLSCEHLGGAARRDPALCLESAQGRDCLARTGGRRREGSVHAKGPEPGG